MGKKPLELIGRKFGFLTVKKQAKNKHGSTYWVCQCTCGKLKIYRGDFLKKGAATSCGCKHGLDIKEYIKSKVKINTSTGCWEFQGFRNKEGYGRMGWRGKQWSAHRLSYVIFNGSIQDTMQIQHICNNPGCVNPKHLKEGNPSQNSAYMLACRRQIKGEKCHFAKLRKSDINEIRIMRMNGVSYNDIAKKYNVNITTVESVIYGKTWSHVPFPQGYQYRKCSPATITEDQVREIKKMLANNIRGCEIAKHFNISKYIVHQIKHGITWKHVFLSTEQSESSGISG